MSWDWYRLGQEKRKIENGDQCKWEGEIGDEMEIKVDEISN